MAKMNRRDYLKRMAAGGGILAGASNLNLFQLTPAATLNAQKKPKAGNILPVAAALNWPLTNTSPILTPFVSVILDGLMGFFYDGPSKTCKVGFHAGHGDHSLRVKLKSSPSHQFPHPIPNHIQSMSLKLAGNAQGPKFFQKPAPFKRDASDNELDFRWLPDLDGDDFYPRGYAKNADRFKAWLFVLDGTIYTRVKTQCEFQRINVVTQRNLGDFGRVAKTMAVSLAVEQDVLFQINGLDFPLTYRAGDSYEIIIKNECWSNGWPCQFEINHPNDETKRNHFHHARDVLQLPPRETKIGLRVLPNPSNQMCNGASTKSTDAAPCMGAGYGQDGV